MIQQSINQLLTLAGAGTAVALHDAQKQTDNEFTRAEEQKNRAEQQVEIFKKAGVPTKNAEQEIEWQKPIFHEKDIREDRGNLIGEIGLKRALKGVQRDFASDFKNATVDDLKSADLLKDEKALYKTIDAIRNGVMNRERSASYLEFLKKQREEGTDILAEIRKRKESEK